MTRRALALLPILSLVWGCSDTQPAGGDGIPAEGQSSLRTAASEQLSNRHPKRFSPAIRPRNVPEDFVLTRNGFMHPSCVYRVEADETLDHNGVIRGPNGTVRQELSRCPYERYAKSGELIPPHESPSTTPRPHATYDGWILYYEYWGSIAAGTTISANWVVPASPTVTASDSQDIAFFNDILTETDGGDILQPVLDYNSGRWSIESEHCCINGNDAYNAPSTAMSVGDTIVGTVKGSNCSANGTCSTWLVTTVDTTKNVTATLTVTNATGVPNGAHSAVLETYGVTACNMLPASGKETFANNSVTDGNGNAQSLKFTFGTNPPSGYPACGYAGTVAGNDYTLIFSTSVGGSSSTGGTAATGGRTSTGGSIATTGGAAVAATGGRTSTGGSIATTGGAAVAATGGRTSTGSGMAIGGSATGTGGKATGGVTTNTTSLGAGTSAVGGGSGAFNTSSSPSSSSDTGSCSCRTPGAPVRGRDLGGSAAILMLVSVMGFRRRATVRNRAKARGPVV